MALFSADCTTPRLSRAKRQARAGLTLVEVVVALGISVLAVAGIVAGYLFGIGSAQRSVLSLAASAKALERLEEARSAKWDLSSWPAVDELVASNFPNEVIILSLADAGSTAVYATNFTQIAQISTDPPLKTVHVDCVWTFKGAQLLTNAMETCRAPDQ
jgi:type II secretory pathway pseudopilin PulG